MPRKRTLALAPAGGMKIYEAWEIQRDESSKAFAAFAHYRDQGPKRTVLKVVREFFREEWQQEIELKGRHCKSLVVEQVNRWKARHCWEERCLAWDGYCDLQAREATVTEIRNYRKKVVDMARVVSGKIFKAIASKTEEELSMLEMPKLAQLLEQGLALERRGMEIPDLSHLGGYGSGKSEAALLSVTEEDLSNQLRGIVATVDGEKSTVDVGDFGYAPPEIVDTPKKKPGRKKQNL